MNRYTPFLTRLVLESIFLFMLSSSIFAQSQNQGYFTISVDLVTGQVASPQQSASTTQEDEKEAPRFFTASAEDTFTPKGKEKEEGIPSYYRQHKMLPEKFSGYVIELLQSSTKLERDYPLFKRFGNIKIDHLGNGNYSYCIIANFKKQSRVKIFANEVIVPYAPDAKVWKYKRGKRKKM